MKDRKQIYNNIFEKINELSSLQPILTPRKDDKFNELKSDIIKATDFLPENSKVNIRLKYIKAGLTDIKKCKCGCGNPVKKFESDYIRGHSNLDNTVKQKKIETTRKNYGVDNPSQSGIIEQKKKETQIKNWDSPHYMSSISGYKQHQKKLINASGYDNPFKNPEFINKHKENYNRKNKNILERQKNTRRKSAFNNIINSRIIDKFKPLFSENEYTDVQSQYQFQCLKCGNITVSTLDDGKIPRCYICNPVINKRCSSDIETNIAENINQLGIKDLIQHSRNIIPPYEIDFYIPSMKIGIELNGIYWHSELNGKNKNYHINKTEMCKKNDIRLIQIFEDEWVYKNDIVTDRLKHIFQLQNNRIYARNCIVREISTKEKDSFLNKHHIQGSDKSKIKLGLFYNNQLVSIMTFGNLRIALGNKPENNSWELCRYATSFNISVIGGAGKLLKYFERKFNPETIISYADYRWSNGNLYKQLNFNYKYLSQPNYWYIVNRNRIHRFNFRKNILNEKLEQYDSSLTEWQNMQNNGYDRIWDCGNLVFEKIYK